MVLFSVKGHANLSSLTRNSTKQTTFLSLAVAHMSHRIPNHIHGSTPSSPTPQRSQSPQSPSISILSLKNLHKDPLVIPDRPTLLPPVYVHKGTHPRTGDRTNRPGIDYVLIANFTNTEFVQKLMTHGFRRPVSRCGNVSRSQCPHTQGIYITPSSLGLDLLTICV